MRAATALLALGLSSCGLDAGEASAPEVSAQSEPDDCAFPVTVAVPSSQHVGFRAFLDERGIKHTEGESDTDPPWPIIEIQCVAISDLMPLLLSASDQGYDVGIVGGT